MVLTYPALPGLTFAFYSPINRRRKLNEKDPPMAAFASFSAAPLPPPAPDAPQASASARALSQASFGETSPERPIGRVGGPYARLEHLLRARKLDRTLTTTGPRRSGVDLAAFGLLDLDERLVGGLPRGQVSELIGPVSSGRTSLAWTWLGAATARGESVALIDTFDPTHSRCASAKSRSSSAVCSLAAARRKSCSAPVSSGTFVSTEAVTSAIRLAKAALRSEVWAVSFSMSSTMSWPPRTAAGAGPMTARASSIEAFRSAGSEVAPTGTTCTDFVRAS